MEQLRDALSLAQQRGVFTPLREAARNWALWALDNLTGDHLRAAIEISIAMSHLADLDEAAMNANDLRPLNRVSVTSNATGS